MLAREEEGSEREVEVVQVEGSERVRGVSRRG